MIRSSGVPSLRWALFSLPSARVREGGALGRVDLRISVRFRWAVSIAIPDLFSIIDRDLRIVLSLSRRVRIGPEIAGLFSFCYNAYYGRDDICEPCHAVMSSIREKLCRVDV